MDVRRTAQRPPAHPSTDYRARIDLQGTLAGTQPRLRGTSPTSDDPSDVEQDDDDVHPSPTAEATLQHPQQPRQDPSYRPPYPTFHRAPLDTVSDEDETPFNPADASRARAGRPPIHHNPPDDGQHIRQPIASSQRPVSAHRQESTSAPSTHTSRDDSGSDGESSMDYSEAGEQHLEEQQREPPRANPDTSVRKSPIPPSADNSRSGSGTSAPQQQPPIPRAANRDQVPMPAPASSAPPPAAPAQPAAPAPPSQSASQTFTFNRERYPAYDAQARRIGLEHTRLDSFPAPGGSYYRPRTHHYPGPNTNMNELPHVMSIQLNSNNNNTSGSRSNTAAPQVPNQQSLQSAFPVRDPSSRPGPSDPPAFHQSPSPIAHDEESGEFVRETTPTLRQMLGLGPDEEVSLRALTDPPPGDKPNYPYPTLIKLAIHGSPNKRLTLQEIYIALEDRFEWYRNNTHDKSWQNSIRHNLSLNKCFRRVPRQLTDPGKGSYWVVDYSQGEGNKRVRKRNKKPNKTEMRRMAEEAAARGGGAEESADEVENTLAAPATPSIAASPNFTPQLGGPSTIARDRASGTRSPASTTSGTTDVSCSFPGPARSDSLPLRGPPVAPPRMNESYIDPQLRTQGHVVGEGRTRQPISGNRRPSSPYLPSVQIRQSARPRARQASPYDDDRSPSPAYPPPPPPPSRYPQSSFSQPGVSHVSQRAYEPSTARTQPTFGQGSLAVSTQYTVPAPSNWTPYSASVPSSSSFHQHSAPSSSSHNDALMLANVHGNPPASTAYNPPPPPPTHTRPYAAPHIPARSHVPMPPRAPVEGHRRRGSGGNRRVYTDSRGVSYPPSNTDGYSSASSQE